jgi:hypothetical protein
MRKTTILSLFAAFLLSACSQQESMQQLITDRLDRSIAQSEFLAQSLMDQSTRVPRTTNAEGKLLTTSSGDWVGGFFPGTLWYLYEYKPSEQLLDYAKNYTARMEKQQYNTRTHDLGFMIYDCYGPAYRVTKDTADFRVLLNGAESLASRYNAHVGLIRSWDWNRKRWQYPVIIDNMMNLEYMFWASKETGNPKYRDLAISHADKTMANHFREDYSTYHVVSYDTISGQPEMKVTHQGYADSSAWARGQGWGLYGYTMMYRETQDAKYLEQAKHIAEFILNNPNLPADKIPYWDFNAPNIPDAKRDASAGALMASAFIELSGYVEPALAKKYLKTAETQLRTLSSPEYFAEYGTNGGFILKHSVGNMPGNGEVDVPLSYADYYYVEALTRYNNYLKQK